MGGSTMGVMNLLLQRYREEGRGARPLQVTPPEARILLSRLTGGVT